MSDTYCDLSDFCYELKGGEQSEYRRHYPSGPDRVLLRTSQLVVCADLSPLMIGHLLVIPIDHFPSMGAFELRQPGHLIQVLAGMLPRYERTFGDAAIFEHGSSSTMTSSACIIHAHLHVIPFPAPALVDAMRRDGLTVWESSWEEVSRVASRDEPYFLAGTARELWIAQGVSPASQYFRNTVSRLSGAGDGEYDWALILHPEWLVETLERWNDSAEPRLGDDYATR